MNTDPVIEDAHQAHNTSRVADADSYVRRRAAQGSARQMLDILEMAPKVEPEERDWIG
jgi:hypothetical protein